MGTTSRKAMEQLRQFALSLPEATEDHPWGETVVKVKGKVFVFLGKGDEGCGLSVKLPESGTIALSLPNVSPTRYGLGKSGWVTAEFGPKDALPVPTLCQWIEESYRAVAPKKLAQALAGAQDKKKAAPKRRR